MNLKRIFKKYSLTNRGEIRKISINVRRTAYVAKNLEFDEKKSPTKIDTKILYLCIKKLKNRK